ncbi:aminodeoxychorismate lyase [Halopseudomonas salegens]|uniref:Aminodeoxychorismate lyase n=1 Tax=Halopseudomonas salegens TaxID=1434072 RepID=A0A1H2EZN7_9GAMM|nr:aminodeoxychorismate lyase [Halopseudomonas salegens]SDU00562.1 aminodeoxychorismate lyase apoprotein [Halopseudomonas salegens]
MVELSPGFTLIDGQPCTELNVRDRGLAYGDGLFETLRVAQGRIPLLEQHLARLSRGADRLHIACDTRLLAQELSQLALQLGGGILKLILTRGDGQRGYALPKPQRPRRIVQVAALPAYPPAHAEQGVCLYPCATRLGQQPLLAGIKHLNRLEQVLARAEWDDPAYAEGLVCDQQGAPVECTVSNLFLRYQGGWLTPALDQCGVQGVMRDYLCTQLDAVGQPVGVRPVTQAELLASSEVFCCNSVFGVWPVIGLGSQQWSIGPHTRQAQALAQQVLL